MDAHIDDSSYSPQPDAPSHSPHFSRDIPAQNLTANDRAAKYRSICQEANLKNTQPDHHDPASIYTLFPTGLAGSNMAGHDEPYIYDSAVLVPSDDDGADTVSSSSFALVEPSLDDSIHSVNGDEDDRRGEEEEHLSDSEHEAFEPVFQPSDSGITTKPDVQTPEASILTETARGTVEENEKNVNQTRIQSFDSHWEATSSESGYAEPENLGAQDILHWSGPFRILFAGFPPVDHDDLSPEHRMAHKLASAIRVGQANTPNTPPPNTHITSILMDGFGCSVIIKEIRGDDSQSPVTCTPLPDLVIVCDDLIWPKDGKLSTLCGMVNDGGVPFIRIGPDLLPHTNSPRTMSLETLLKLDDVQVNRHLAYIGVSSHVEQTNCQVKTLRFGNNWKKEMRVWLGDHVHRVGTAVRTQPTYALFMAGLIFVFVTAMLFAGVVFPRPGQKAEQAAALNSALQAYTGARSDVTVVQCDLVPNAMSMSPVRSGPDKALAKDTTSKSVSVVEHSFTVSTNDPEKFKMGIVGGRHVVVVPPKSWTWRWKTPKLVIRVRRGSETVPSTVEQLVEGVHVVSIEPKDAYGTLNVTVATKSRSKTPAQSLTVDFGSSWLKPARWGSILSTDLAFTQSNARNTTLALFKHVEAFCNASKNMTDVLLHSADLGMQKALQALQLTQEVGDKICEEYCKKPKDVVGGIVTAARGLTETRPVLRARRNAIRLSRKLGEHAEYLLQKAHEAAERMSKGNGMQSKDTTKSKRAKP